jgi:hypothetical protein
VPLAERACETFLLAIHHSHDVRIGESPPHADLRIQGSAYLVDLNGIERLTRRPSARDSLAKAREKPFGDEVLGRQDDAFTEGVGEARAEER